MWSPADWFHLNSLMVKRIEGNTYHDELGLEPCKGITIGDLIEYLGQFPESWPIDIRTPERPGERFVLLNEFVATVLTEEGEGKGP